MAMVKAGDCCTVNTEHYRRRNVTVYVTRYEGMQVTASEHAKPTVQSRVQEGCGTYERQSKIPPPPGSRLVEIVDCRDLTNAQQIRYAGVNKSRGPTIDRDKVIVLKGNCNDKSEGR